MQKSFSKKEITDFIINFFLERGTNINEDNYQDINYVDNAIIDSFEILTLLMTIEDTFNIKITPMDLAQDNYKTLGKLITLISSKQT